MAQLSGLLVIEKVNISQQQGIDRFKGQAGHLQTGYSLSVFIGQIMLLVHTCFLTQRVNRVN